MKEAISEKKQKITNTIKLLIFVGVIATIIKSIFTEYGYDASYHLAMSWRHINGDRMFREMWEPHQTSAFMLDVLMSIYRMIVPTMTGVALYLQITGTIFFIVITVILYICLKKRLDRNISEIVCMILLMARPKGVLLIEFSNLLILSSTLLLASLIIQYCSDNLHSKTMLAVLQALLSFAMMLAYPSCAIVAVFMVVLHFRHSKKDAIAYILSLISMIIVYGIVVTRIVDTKDVFNNMLNILSGDGSHSVSKWKTLFDIKTDVVYLVNIIFPILIITGFLGRKLLNDTEKRIWTYGTAISIISFLGVVALSNLSIFPSFGYLVMGGAVALIPISKLTKNNTQLIPFMTCMVLVLARGLFVMNGYSAINGRFIANVENVIRTGPCAGIVAPLSVCNYTRESMNDWNNNIESTDVVLAVGNWIIDSTVYMYTDASVANYSTIDTTTYSDSLITYWNKYPEKKPTVIAYERYIQDDLELSDSVIDQYIGENYELSNRGEYWSFYKEKNNNPAD